MSSRQQFHLFSSFWVIAKAGTPENIWSKCCDSSQERKTLEPPERMRELPRHGEKVTVHNASHGSLTLTVALPVFVRILDITVKHILTECWGFEEQRRSFLNVPNYSDLFKRENLAKLIEFCKQSEIYNLI